MRKRAKLRRGIRAGIDHFDREIECTRRNKELMNFLDARRHETRTVKAAEVKKQLKIK